MKPQSGAIHILLPLVLFIALGVIIFFVSSVGKLHRLEEENQALQVEIDKLNADVALLKFKAGL